MREITISKNEANQRLDKFLNKLLNEAPGGFCYKMLRKKNIVLNGKKALGSERLREGDCVKLFLSEETFQKFHSRKSTLRTKERLNIIYEDPDVILINKPAGMLSQKAKAEDVSLVEHLISYLLESGSVTEEGMATFSPSVCNRLDRNTSGLVAAGKSLVGLQTLSAWFRDRTIEKYYLCLVLGSMTQGQRISGYLKKDEKNNRVRITKQPVSGAAAIQTEYRPVCTRERATLLEVHLLTGKTHQIRAHLASIGHPIIGDPKYGERKRNQRYREKFGLNSQMLHAYRLEIPAVDGPLSRLSGKTFCAPIPDTFQKICKAEGVM